VHCVQNSKTYYLLGNMIKIVLRLTYGRQAWYWSSFLLIKTLLPSQTPHQKHKNFSGSTGRARFGGLGTNGPLENERRGLGDRANSRASATSEASGASSDDVGSGLGTLTEKGGDPAVGLEELEGNGSDAAGQTEETNKTAIRSSSGDLGFFQTVIQEVVVVLNAGGIGDTSVRVLARRK
jgi:hypothetical protein